MDTLLLDYLPILIFFGIAAVIGMRHVLAHGYDIIKPKTIWDTIRDDLPPLIRQLDEILGRAE